MMRGDLVTIAMQGDFGKPLSALVMQANPFSEHSSTSVLLITVYPNAENCLQKPSQVMVDKVMTVKRDKVGPSFGHIDADALVEVESCLAVFLGIAK